MKNTLEEINSRLDEAKDQIRNSKEKVAEDTNLSSKIKKIKNEGSLRELWHSMKCNNIYIIGVLEGEESEQGIENLFEEIITKTSLIW